jgi:prophage regulatory protein
MVTKPKKFLRWKQFKKSIPICKATWWKGVKDGRYPPSHKFSRKAVCWLDEDIESLLKYIATHGVPSTKFRWNDFKASI